MGQICDDAEVNYSAFFMISLPKAWKNPCSQNFFNGRFAAAMGNHFQLLHPLLDERSYMRTKHLVEQRLFPAEVILYQCKMDTCMRGNITNGNLPESFCRK